MMGYGDVLLNVGLIDQIDNKGYKEMEDMIRSLIKQKKWHAAFQVLHQNIPRQSMFYGKFYLLVSGGHSFAHLLLTRYLTNC